MKNIMITISMCVYALLIIIHPSETSAANLTYSYDNLSRLTKVDYGNGLTEQYSYDAAGNRLTLSIVDNAPPTGSITINNGATYTATTAVTLNLQATDDSGVAQMCISNTPSCNAWEAYATAKNWTLPAGEGVKTVYASYKDNAGNVNSTPFSASITLGPSLLTTTASPAGGTYSTQLIVTLSANEQATIYYTTDGSTPTTGSSRFEAQITVNVSMTLKYFAVDAFGNNEQVKTASYTISDITPPTGTVAINAGAAATKALQVVLGINANDPSGVTQMCISNTETCTDWQAFAQSLPWQLTNGDGLKTVRAWFRDGAGNSNTQPYSATVTLDMTAPTLTLFTLNNGASTNNATLNIPGTVTDNSGVKTLTMNDNLVQVASDNSFSYALPLVVGPNTVKTVATDLAGNPTTDTRIITYDTTAPEITINSPADNSAVATHEVEIKGSVNKDAIVTVKVNTSDPQNAIMNGMEFSFTATLISGANTIEVIATDLAGNSATVKRTVTFDNQKPSLAITDPIQDISISQAGYLLKGTVTDTLTETTVVITVDGQTFQQLIVNGAFSQQLNFTTEKTYAIAVIASDAAGNKTTVLRNIIYDITKPPVSMDVTSPTRLASQTISGTREADSVVSVASATASVGAVTYPTSTTWSVLVDNMTEGTNHVVVTAHDFAGNETVVTKDILFDVSPPVNGSLTALPGNGQVSLSWGYTDSLSGIDRYRLVFDALTAPASCENGSVAYEGSATAIVQSGLANGVAVHYLLCAYDRAGNMASGVTASATPVSPDTTPPTGTVTINAGASATKALQVVLGINASDPSGVAQMCISNSVACTNWENYSDAQKTWQLAAGDGLKTVSIWFRDSLGNTDTQSYSASITLDTTAPVLTISALPNGAYTNNATLNLTGTAVDAASGIKQLTINGADVPVKTDGTFSHPVVLVAGANTITTIATDNVGYQKTDIRTINYDHNAPLLTIIAPADNSRTNKSFIDVTGTIDENATVAVKVNTNGSQMAAINGNTFTYTANLAVGSNTIEVTATDLATNSTTAKRTLIYDNLSPSLAITNPVQDFTTSQNSLLLKGTVTDTYSAVTVTVSVDGKTFTPPVVNGAFEQAITFTAAKSYAIIVTATDEAMNSTSVQRNVIYAQQKWNDVSAQTSITKSTTIYDRLNNTYYVNISVKNTSAIPLSGPVRMVIVNPSIPLMTNLSVGLKPDGYTTAGEPYFNIVPQTGTLAVGATISNLRVNFEVQRVTLTYGVRVEQYK